MKFICEIKPATRSENSFFYSGGFKKRHNPVFFKSFKNSRQQSNRQNNKKDEIYLKQNSSLENFNLLKETLKFNEETNEITAAESDWLLIRAQFLRDIFDHMSSMNGVDGKTILNEVGKITGRNLGKHLLKQGMKPSEIPVILNLLLNEGGWGKTEINIDQKKKMGVITIKNNVIARHKKTKEPSCHFLTGYFKGLSEMLFGIETECSETNCVAKGDLACKFHIRLKQKNGEINSVSVKTEFLN